MQVSVADAKDRAMAQLNELRGAVSSMRNKFNVQAAKLVMLKTREIEQLYSSQLRMLH